MEEKLGGNIVLNNFKLDNQEITVAKKIIGNYAKKIREIADYNELKIDMQIHDKFNPPKFEINAFLRFGDKNVEGRAEGFNPYVLIDRILNKLFEEAKNKLRR